MIQNKAFQKKEFEAYAIFDIVKNWYFERQGATLNAYYSVISKQSISQNQVWELRANCIMMYLSLKDKVDRQKKGGRLTADEIELCSKLEKIVADPHTIDKSIEGGEILKPLGLVKFWSKVVMFEVKLMDTIGITRIDMEKKDTIEKAMSGMYD